MSIWASLPQGPMAIDEITIKCCIFFKHRQHSKLNNLQYEKKDGS